MLLTRPQRIVFENQDDIVKYVTRGLPPRKSDFDQVISLVKNPMSDSEVASATANDIVISERVFFDIDKEQFARVLEKVYKENCRNRNILIASTTALVVGMLFSFSGSDKEKE